MVWVAFRIAPDPKGKVQSRHPPPFCAPFYTKEGAAPCALIPYKIGSSQKGRPMKIRHERPMSDLSYEVRAPLSLELAGGERVRIDAWSLSGFTYPGSSDILPRHGVLSIPFQGVDIRFKVDLEPGDAPRELTFQGLTGRQRETLAVFYRSILSGKMACTEEVITSLDTPVDLVPMGETEAEKTAGMAGKSARSLRVVWNGLFYSLFAIVVFGLIGSTIYDRLSGIRLQHGRVSAPLVELRTGSAAYIADIPVAVGDAVQAGDVLIRLNDPDRDGALDAVRADIRLAERRLQDAVDRLDAVTRRKADHRAGLVAQIATAQRGLGVAAFIGGYNTAAYVAAVQALRAFDTGADALALQIQEQQAQLAEMIAEREIDLRQLKRDLSNAKDANDAINVIATTDGIVRDLPLTRDLFVARGTLAGVVEQNAPRTAVGWISERAAQSLHVGQAARLRVSTPEGSRLLAAAISDITAGVDPARPTEFGVIVTLQLQDPDLDKNRAVLRPGAPVEIRADRGWALTPYVLAFKEWWS